MFHPADRIRPTKWWSAKQTKSAILIGLLAAMLVTGAAAGLSTILTSSGGAGQPVGSGWHEASAIFDIFQSSGLSAESQHAHGKQDSESDAGGSETSRLNDWLAVIFPDHGFHPLVIHFPIALFVFGTLLEFVGWWRGDFRIRQAAFWNLAAGSLSTLVVIPTGAVAFILSDYTWKGSVVPHMAFAGSAALLMAGTVLWRRKGPHASPWYFALLALATITLGVAGYFGGELIYGL